MKLKAEKRREIRNSSGFSCFEAVDAIGLVQPL
jgi:hypothetical protein